MFEDAVKIDWVDRGREPQCAPDPLYPHGLILDTSEGATKTCNVDLPYPAKRCGTYVVHCRKCLLTVALTAAGRPDDPRVATLGCYSQALSADGRTKIITHPKKTAWIPPAPAT